MGDPRGPMPRCKHDRRFFDDCPECENEAEIALSGDIVRYVEKLKARIAELEGQLRASESKRDLECQRLSEAVNVLAACVQSVPELITEEADANPIARAAIEKARKAD